MIETINIHCEKRMEKAVKFSLENHCLPSLFSMLTYLSNYFDRDKQPLAVLDIYEASYSENAMDFVLSLHKYNYDTKTFVLSVYLVGGIVYSKSNNVWGIHT